MRNHPEVTVVLSGMNNDNHIQENLAMAEKAQSHSLSEKEVTLVAEAANEFRRVMKVEGKKKGDRFIFVGSHNLFLTNNHFSPH